MSDIEKAVKTTIEEFGDDAFKRFLIEINSSVWVNLKHNDQLVFWSNQKPKIVKIKPQLELFTHDVVVYGDNAHLMWTKYNPDKNKDQPWLSNDDSCLLIGCFAQWQKRKTSAALPFDLERAKSGDVVEWFLYDGWKVINNAHYSQLGISKMHGRIDIGFTGRDSKWVMEKHLRMKYPPKAK